MPLTSPVWDAVYPAEIQLPYHIVGNPWPGFPLIGPVTFESGTPYSELAIVRFILSHSLGHRPNITLTSEVEPSEPECRTLYEKISIINSATWVFSILALSGEDFNIPQGNWAWRIEMEDVNGLLFDAYRGVLTATL